MVIVENRPVICKFIEQATKEYEQNGRSAKFISMENRIADSGKPLYIYFFARYVKGANIERLQYAMLECANLEQCYYFQKNVVGARLRPFVEKALQEKDLFWIEKFIEFSIQDYASKRPDEVIINKSNRINVDTTKAFKYAQIDDLVQDVPYPTTRVARAATASFDINYIIEEASAEFELYGRSPKFMELEKQALHTGGVASSILFLQRIQGANVKAFERVALLRGDPFNMFLIATGIKGANIEFMLKGLEIAKLDYVAKEQSLIAQTKRKEEILTELQTETDEKTIKRLKEAYSHIPNIAEYVVKIDNEYIPRINYLLKREGKFKK